MAKTLGWLEETRSAVARASDQAQLQDEFDTISGYLDRLKSVVDELQSLASAAPLARANGWTGATASPDIWSLLDKTSEGFERRDIEALLTRLEPYRRDVRDSLVDGWRVYVDSQMGQAVELRQLAEVLGQIDGLAPLARKLEASISALIPLQRGLPDKRAVKILGDARSLLEQLQSQLEPKSVRAFVTAVSTGGASLSLLSEEVLAWIEQHDAGERFKIVAGRPAK